MRRIQAPRSDLRRPCFRSGAKLSDGALQRLILITFIRAGCWWSARFVLNEHRQQRNLKGTMTSQSTRNKRGATRAEKSHEDLERLKLQTLFELPEVESWRTLMAAFQSVYRELEHALLQEECSISRFQILLILHFFGPITASEIAKRLCVTRGNISMFLKRLKADGLVETVDAGRDSKRPLLRLTNGGSELFRSLFPGHIRRICKLVPVFSPEMLEVLRRVAQPSGSVLIKKR